MEAYSGLVILATNIKSALDTAFMRWLRFIVNFPFPDRSDRKQMWQKVFPPDTQTVGLDYDIDWYVSILQGLASKILHSAQRFWLLSWVRQ